MEIFREYKSDTHKLEIMYDEHCESPRTSQDNLGTFAMWSNKYSYGDETPDCDYKEFEENLPEGTIALPVYMHNHSSVTFSTSPFHSRWDSGQTGIIYATPETIKNEYGDDDEESRERTISVLKSEIKELALYAEGQCYGYRLYELKKCDHCGHTAAKVIDSCWGYITDKPEATIKELISEEVWNDLL